MLTVPQDVTAPSAITILFKSPLFSVDLTDVTAVSLNVTRKDGTTGSWAMTIVSSTPYELVAQYTFTGEDEITTTGVYYLAPTLTVPGGSVPGEPVAMFVTLPGGPTPRVEATSWIMVTSNIPSLGPVKHTWKTVDDTDSPYTASAVSPWVALDLRSGPIEVDLWEGQEGDNIILTDIYHAAGDNALTLVAAGSQTVPVGDGTFDTSATYTSTGFASRLKLTGGLWLPW